MKTSGKQTPIPLQSPTKTTATKEPFSLRKVIRFSTASKPQAQPMTVPQGDPGDSEDFASGRQGIKPQVNLEEEVASLRQANEDLKKSLQINKRLIGEIAGGKGNIQEVIKGSVWEMERALEEARN